MENLGDGPAPSDLTPNMAKAPEESANADEQEVNVQDRITEGRTEHPFASSRAELAEGMLLPAEPSCWPRTLAMNVLKHLLCSHRCTERDVLRKTWRCRCGWFEATDLLVRLKPGYWQEYV